ncbi:hypothetical protein K5D34_21170 [Pseudomonas cichorii]|uniref:hypothetical protein n=1 Tax=Pseudomonas syringae group TaxID=136849 RepID=UPI0019100839|nr:hypothetical protein [Pseudomonas cichorii]MBX8492410.1 hypothetical protein [Pseudomonas cichorii]MBX8512197.1 hypothetical protein [Pseudomonas cichorii]MBX8522843.1 hypothetical protein [Pseudomonas cichorii]MBX8527178.1 hypothetical protein [Pseudomonas cichorii]MBX8541247.1 hypothetical protein [Pseudomonas cichorii]
MRTVSLFLGWIFGVLLILIGLFSFGANAFAALLILISGVICLPVVRGQIQARTGKVINGWLVASVVFVLSLTGIILSSNTHQKNIAEKGFVSADEYREAKENGATTKEEWDRIKDGIHAKKALAEDAAKKAALAKEQADIAAAESARKESEAKVQAEKLAKEKSDEKCRLDVTCWGEKHFVAAAVFCKTPIEKLAQYDVKWTDGVLEPKFSRYKWADKERGVITFFGDKIQYQNGFGAFQNHIYSCDYNTLTEQVVKVNAQPGRL